MSKFVIYRDIAGYYRWRLVARNGEIVAASEAYTARSSAVRSAKRVKEIASFSQIIE